MSFSFERVTLCICQSIIAFVVVVVVVRVRYRCGSSLSGNTVSYGLDKNNVAYILLFGDVLTRQALLMDLSVHCRCERSTYFCYAFLARFQNSYFCHCCQLVVGERTASSKCDEIG